MTVDDIRFLYAFNRWANARTLATASPLTPEELTRDLRSSHRSVLETLAHILWGEWLWLGRWSERPSPGESPLKATNLDALRSRWLVVEEGQSRFITSMTADDLTRALSYENPPGTRWTYSLQQMLQHVVNHSTYHRGQVAGMLRQLGLVPLPTDLLVYLDELFPR